MPNLKDLRQHVAYAGRGAWDTKLFEDPGGVNNPQMGFGCFYAVPLRTGDGLPKDKIIGVFKIERRRHKPIFDEDERKAFDLAATSISRTLQEARLERSCAYLERPASRQQFSYRDVSATARSG
jgi:hypothetical protein